MSLMSRVWAAIVTGFISALAIPAVAWAHESGAAEVLRRRPKIGFGFFGALCCLVVVAGVVLVVFLVLRSRKR